ncbi:tryptophan-rich sensory protein, partial [Staphylococcus epidermidis]|nr:tryptophan-rich sensory protein [Staphylococcus epidermidis]
MINIKKVTRIVLPLAGGMVIGRLTAKAQNDYK